MKFNVIKVRFALIGDNGAGKSLMLMVGDLQSGKDKLFLERPRLGLKTGSV